MFSRVKEWFRCWGAGSVSLGLYDDLHQRHEASLDQLTEKRCQILTLMSERDALAAEVERLKAVLAQIDAVHGNLWTAVANSISDAVDQIDRINKTTQPSPAPADSVLPGREVGQGDGERSGE